MAPHRCDSITTIARTARTSPSATARAIGSPFAANGGARKMAQSSQDRQGSQARISDPILPDPDRFSRVVYDNREALMAICGLEASRQGESAPCPDFGYANFLPKFRPSSIAAA